MINNLDEYYGIVNNSYYAFKKSYYSYVAYRYVIWMAESSLVSDRRKKQLIREMKSYTWLLNYDGIERVRKARLAYRILGFHGASKLLGI